MSLQVWFQNQRAKRRRMNELSNPHNDGGISKKKRDQPSRGPHHEDLIPFEPESRQKGVHNTSTPSEDLSGMEGARGCVF